MRPRLLLVRQFVISVLPYDPMQLPLRQTTYSQSIKSEHTGQHHIITLAYITYIQGECIISKVLARSPNRRDIIIFRSNVIVLNEESFKSNLAYDFFLALQIVDE